MGAHRHVGSRSARRVSAAAAAVGLVAAGVVVAAGTDTAAATPASQLSPGQQLDAGQSLTSAAGGGFRLVLRADGNLVEYLVSAGRAVWATNTSGHGATLKFQTDGNVVLYSATKHPLWQTRTHGSGAVSFGVNVNGALFAATTRHLVWSSPPKLAADDVAIARLTSSNGHYRAVMQTDGNFVVYSAHGVLWSSKTAKHYGAYLVVQQSDGNVVIYDRHHHALWSTATTGKSAVLRMQNDGNLVLYAGSVDHSVAIWNSKAAPAQTKPAAPAATTPATPTREPAVPAATTPATATSCHPLTNGGGCYEPGEFCRNSDHGVTGVAGDGKTITCENNNGWRWEPA